jgi:hypothetical protein
MADIIYPGLAHQSLSIAKSLHQGEAWEKIRELAWLKYQQMSHRVGRKEEFYAWADKQRNGEEG